MIEDKIAKNLLANKMCSNCAFFYGQQGCPERFAANCFPEEETCENWHDNAWTYMTNNKVVR